MDADLLHSARQSLELHAQLQRQSFGLPGGAMPQASATAARPQPVDLNQSGYNLSQSAMLVGTVAALQEESGQLRSQWKSDVNRLESELAQLRSAAAWALPHLAEQNAPANIQLMNRAALEPSNSAGNLNAAQLQGVLAERLSQQRTLDALLAHGTGADQGSGMLTSPSKIDAALRSGAMTERGGRPGGLEALLRERASAGEAAQLEAAMMMQRNMNIQRNSSTGLADVVRSQIKQQELASATGASSCGASERGRAVSVVSGEQNTTSQEQNKAQMVELYKELETITLALQEAQQENRKLKEDKEASETAHARDVAALEAMLQQMTVDNDKLTKDLRKAEEQLHGFSNNMIKVNQNRPPSTPASIRSASIEPAIEPDTEQSEFDRMKLQMGLRAQY